jgi:hypothetical protein
MRIRRRSLDRLISTRGRAPSSAAACITADYGDGWVEVDTQSPAYPRASPGLGDMVAAALDAVGITKARVEAVVGGPCGCPKRQAWLNDAGEKWLGMPPGRD